MAHVHAEEFCDLITYLCADWPAVQASDLEDPSTNAAKTFRRRFRVPYPVFVMLVDWTKRFCPGQSKNQSDAFRRPAIPVALKVLAVLGILGRGTSFDNNRPICASNTDRNRDSATTPATWRQSRRAMGKGGIVFYFWEADTCEKRLAWPKYCS